MKTRDTKISDSLHEWRLLLAFVFHSIIQAFVSVKNNVIYSPKMLYHYMISSVKFYQTHPAALKNEVLGGISIAIMQVPESIAFSFVARISPIRGMTSTFFVGLFGGLITALPGLVSGIAGGMVAIIAEITSDDGPLQHKCLSERVEYAMGIMLFCSIIQLLTGVFDLPRFIKLVPHSVMIGFMNGLAIIVFKAQLYAFQTNDEDTPSSSTTSTLSCPALDYTPPANQRWLRLNEPELWLVLLIVALSMACMVLQPRIKKRWKLFGGRISLSARVIPPALTAMIITTLLGNLLFNRVIHIHIRLIGDEAQFPPGNIPTFHVPQVDWASSEFWLLAVRYGILLALVGLIESIMTWRLCQRLIKVNQPLSLAKWESYAQGCGNLWASLFGSIGGSVMVGQSMVNFTNGSRGRLSTTIAAFVILLILSVAGAAIEQMPVATLTGILFVVVIKTFEWKTFEYIIKLSIPITDIISIILVTILAVTTDLAIAVLIGICWCSVVYAWKSSRYTLLSDHQSGSQTQDKKSDIVTVASCHNDASALVLHLHGPLFFGSSTDLVQYLIDHEETILDSPVATLIVDFSLATVYDSSGIEFLRYLANEVVIKRNKKLQLVYLDERSKRIVCRSKKVRELTKAADDSGVETFFDMNAEDIQRAESGLTGWVEGTENGRLQRTISSLYEEDTVNKS